MSDIILNIGLLKNVRYLNYNKSVDVIPEAPAGPIYHVIVYDIIPGLFGKKVNKAFIFESVFIDVDFFVKTSKLDTFNYILMKKTQNSDQIIEEILVFIFGRYSKFEHKLAMLLKPLIEVKV